ncbi:MAG TPA: fibronectin type III domain-containing protein, partial [Phaeodactylibacter sp.]|nr:fibronectin type III domain-containing protein [Phaeodactylibacter sp.]
MKKLTLFLFILISFLCKTNNLYAQNWSLERSVQMYAEINESPPSITLHWESQPVYGFTLYRRLKGASSWGSPLAELNGDVNTYIDNDVSIGISYEYKIVKDAAISGFGSINAGIKLPMVDYRGGLILLVDQTHADELSFELERLRTDLEGDGWVVARIDLSPDDEVTAVKQAIVSKINFDTIAYNAIFLLGHIPVPYSGNLFPDGHTNHEGAWPADLYYGELNSNWTDISVNNSISLDDRNHNIPADGKFDQSVIPSDIELPVGRVDFANMPAFTETETELLRKYLDKHHAFRHKHFTSTRRMLTENNFGGLPEGFAQSAYRNGAAMFGPDEVYTIDYDSLKTGSYLWSFGAGGGTFTSANGITTTEQLAQDSLQTVFAMMFGSYFGDWDADNNLLRATLASGTVLSNVWAGRPKYQFEHMALGEN